MSFAVAAEAYDRFMGRFSFPLAVPLADLADVAAGQRALDVGCGTGALTAELVRRLGAPSVSGVDPSESLIEEARRRHPEADLRVAVAETLPFPDGTFDRTLAELVVHFMTDPVAGLRDMARVTAPDGVIAACTWDHAAGGQGALSTFWEAARDVDPTVEDESHLAGVREGDLQELFGAAGLSAIDGAALWVEVEHASFDAWWEPFTLGAGPAGNYVARLEPDRREALRARCRELLPAAPFVQRARAWAARGCP